MEKKYFANLEYHEVNGVFIPDIELPEEKEIGRFGWQHEAWLKQHRRCRYSLLIGSGEIIDYLARVDAEANEMYESLIADFAKAELTKTSKQPIKCAGFNGCKALPTA